MRFYNTQHRLQWGMFIGRATEEPGDLPEEIPTTLLQRTMNKGSKWSGKRTRKMPQKSFVELLNPGLTGKQCFNCISAWGDNICGCIWLRSICQKAAVLCLFSRALGNESNERSSIMVLINQPVKYMNWKCKGSLPSKPQRPHVLLVIPLVKRV